MRRNNQILTLLLWSSFAQASEQSSIIVFADALYWKVTEEIDWVYENSLNPVDQEITYLKSVFDASPGFRIGAGYEKNWDTAIYYTQFSTNTSDSASGHLKTAFLGGTIGYPPGNIFYDTGQFFMEIDYQVLDWIVGKKFQPTSVLMLHPLIGLEAGWINQSIQADFQGFYQTTEKLKNNFWGIGPRFGLDGALTLFEVNQQPLNLIASFSTAYLIGHWDITDIYTDNSPRTIEVGVDERNFGALNLQAILGVSYVYRDFSLGIHYEINDWFNQGQIFDDATGGHDNDLILQGLSLRIKFTH